MVLVITYSRDVFPQTAVAQQEGSSSQVAQENGSDFSEAWKHRFLCRNTKRHPLPWLRERKGYHRDVASGVDRGGGSATGVTRRCGAELDLVRPWALAGLLHGTRCRRRFCWDGVCDRRPGRTMPALFFGCCFGSLHSSKLVAQNFLTARITFSAVSLRNKPSRVISVKSVSQC